MQRPPNPPPERKVPFLKKVRDQQNYVQVVLKDDPNADPKNVVRFYKAGMELAVELIKAVRECRLHEIHSSTTTEEGRVCHSYKVYVNPQ